MDLVTLNPLCSRYPHQSTSEKQFPVPSLDTIAGLRYGTHCVKIKVRLIRVWDSVSLRTHFEMMTNFILIDEKEKLCWAVTDVAHRPRILSLVCEGLEYYITNFKLVPAQASYKPIDTTNTIIFDKNTDIRGCFDGSFIPRLKFGICSLETLKHRSATTDTLSDVCGVLVKVGRMQREANDEKRLEIHLMDKSLTQLQLTLWGGMATIFTVYLELHRQKNIVLVITGLMVKKRRGNICLSPTLATSVHFNPRSGSTHNLGNHIAEKFGEFICHVPSLIEYAALQLPGGLPPYSTLVEIQQAPLWIHQKFCCKVMIMNILLKQTCIGCKHQVIVSANRYCCEGCGKNFIKVTKSPAVCMLVKDQTSDAELILQPREVQQLTNWPAHALLNMYNDANGPAEAPACIQRMLGSKCTVEVELAPSTHSAALGHLVVQQIIDYTMLLTGNQLLPQ